MYSWTSTAVLSWHHDSLNTTVTFTHLETQIRRQFFAQYSLVDNVMSECVCVCVCVYSEALSIVSVLRERAEYIYASYNVIVSERRFTCVFVTV